MEEAKGERKTMKKVKMNTIGRDKSVGSNKEDGKNFNGRFGKHVQKYNAMKKEKKRKYRKEIQTIKKLKLKKRKRRILINGNKRLKRQKTIKTRLT